MLQVSVVEVRERRVVAVDAPVDARAEEEERVHVEREVDHARVEEAARDDSVRLAFGNSDQARRQAVAEPEPDPVVEGDHPRPLPEPERTLGDEGCQVELQADLQPGQYTWQQIDNSAEEWRVIATSPVIVVGPD